MTIRIASPWNAPTAQDCTSFSPESLWVARGVGGTDQKWRLSGERSARFLRETLILNAAFRCASFRAGAAVISVRKNERKPCGYDRQALQSALRLAQAMSGMSNTNGG